MCTMILGTSQWITEETKFIIVKTEIRIDDENTRKKRIKKSRDKCQRRLCNRRTSVGAVASYKCSNNYTQLFSKCHWSWTSATWYWSHSSGKTKDWISYFFCQSRHSLDQLKQKNRQRNNCGRELLLKTNVKIENVRWYRVSP